jgi:hypothetical protein
MRISLADGASADVRDLALFLLKDCQWSPKLDQVLSRKTDQCRLRFSDCF